MENFKTWLESRAFNKIPPEANALSIKAKQICRDLTSKHLSHVQYPDKTYIGRFPDPFSKGFVEVFALSMQEYERNGFTGNGNMGVLNGKAAIHYRIPMTSYDTIMHEIVHACDPKWRMGLSSSKRNELGQMMNTDHEIDAYIAGKVDDAKDRLKAADPKKRQEMIEELKNWLKEPKNDSNLEPYNVPEVLGGFGGLHNYYADKRLWRKFASTLWNELVNLR